MTLAEAVKHYEMLREQEMSKNDRAMARVYYKILTALWPVTAVEDAVTTLQGFMEENVVPGVKSYYQEAINTLQESKG